MPQNNIRSTFIYYWSEIFITEGKNKIHKISLNVMKLQSCRDHDVLNWEAKPILRSDEEK